MRLRRKTHSARSRTLLIISFALLFTIAMQRSTAQAVPANPATTPTDRLSESWWADRHKAVLAEVKEHPDTQLLMIGDSITNNYDKAHPPDEDFQPTWQTFYAPRKALNLGFSGDATEHVLWRLAHGEVEGLHPRVVVLLIGTNNTGHENQTAEQTEVGIDAVVGALETRLPETRILLLGILPNRLDPSVQQRDLAINRYLANGYGENPRVTYLDIGSTFYRPDGTLNEAIYYDPRLPQHGKPLHPDTVGQRRMAEAIEPTLATLMGEVPRVPLAAMTDINTALIPVTVLEQDSYDWYARHHAELSLARSLQPRVVMIGDSITHFWGGQPAASRVSGAQAWSKLFGTMPVLNLGFGWDRTQNVLWRLRQGEFDGLEPAWVVINIGTNNLTGTVHARASTPDEIADGVSAIYREVHARSPKSHVIVMAIFPRGESAQSPLSPAITATNRLLAERFGHVEGVTYLDIGAQFLRPDGTLPATMMPDGTHPGEEGYSIWADALQKAGIRP